MEHCLSSGQRRARPTLALALALAAIGCTIVSVPSRAQAQQSSAVVEAPDTLSNELGSDDEPAVGSDSPAERESRRMHEAIGGGGELVRGEYYTSPLKKFGSDLFFGSYVICAAVSVLYLGGVLPVQAIFGSSKLEPVMLWMLLPGVGPWIAQNQDSVRSKPFWRVVLIADGALQASGIVLGLIGLALSGRRKLETKASDSVDWKLSLAGPGLAGITLSVHAL